MNDQSRPSDPALMVLFAALSSPNEATRLQAHDRLLAMGAVIVEPLRDLIRRRPDQALEPARLLVKITCPNRLAVLVELLASSNPLIGQIAARELENLGPGAVDVLLDALQNTSYLVRLTVVSVLEQLGDRRAVQPLIAVLEESGESSTLTLATIQALGVLGDPAALDAVKAYVDHPNHHIRQRARTAVDQLNAAPPTESS